MRDEPQSSVFDVEPFGHELPSGLSLRVEDKAEWLSRNEGLPCVLKHIEENTDSLERVVIEDVENRI